MTTINGVTVETRRATIYTTVAKQLYSKALNAAIDSDDALMVDLAKQYVSLVVLIEPSEPVAWYAPASASASEIYAAFEAWVNLPESVYNELVLLWDSVTNPPNPEHLTPNAALPTIADEKKASD